MQAESDLRGCVSLRVSNLVVFAAVVLGTMAAWAQSVPEIVQGQEAAPQEILVKLDNPQALSPIVFQHNIDRVQGVGSTGVLRLHSRTQSAAALLNGLSNFPGVAFVEPNFVVHAINVPNDPFFNLEWGLQNTGQTILGVPGTAGADIKAVPAWDISTGSRTNVVTVIDTGIDYTHPDLTPNVWSAPAAYTVTVGGQSITCAAGTHGLNAITLTCDPLDDNGHGTHVSGTIGAVGNNSQGVAGVNWTASIIGCKFLDASGSGFISDAINCIDFAIQVKSTFASSSGANVRILSNSWGGGGFSQALMDDINRAGTNDMLFVVAAGNSSSNDDTIPTYPPSYKTANMIAVAATNNKDALASFSNYGPATVHLGAPGVNIASTYPGNQYAYLSGTSMAAPHVSGAAALVLSACSLGTAALKSVLLNNVDPIPSLAGITVTGGRLDVNKAIRACAIPSVSLIAPNGLEKLFVGSPFVVQWTSSSLIGLASQDVLLSTDGGLTYPTTLASGLAGTANSFSWTPSATCAFCRIKVVAHDTSGNQGSAASKSNFTVTTGTPSITLTSPTTAVNWGIGTREYIKWTSNLGSAAKVDIDISRDGGSTYTSIVAATANTGSFLWVVTGPNTASAKLRVQWSNDPAAASVSGIAFTIAAPLVTITAPTLATTNWGIGTLQAISWTTNLGPNENVQVLLSTDGGTTFPVVLTSSWAASKGSIIITTPDNPTTQARVQVAWLVDGTVKGVNGVNFTVAAPFITVAKPNGGESWASGATQSISWSNNLGSRENVSVELSTDAGATWQMLKSTTPSYGSLSIVVPSVSSSSCLVRITWLKDTSVSDVSNALFTIGPAFITVTSPNGGESWYVGTSHSIMWKSNLGGYVEIDLSTDGGTTWQVVSASTGNFGSRSWTVPSQPTTQALIRVTSLTAGFTAISDTSNAVFSILQPAVTVVSPNGGEGWTIGTVHAIQWSSNAGGTVKIELSRDGGTTWATLIGGATNNGSYNWTVTSPASSNALVRITSNSFPLVKSTSAAPFSILQPVMTVLSPNGGEVWSIGTVHSIQWSLNTTGNVKIELSRDGGATWITLASSVANSGSFNWIVTSPASPNSVVRATSLLVTTAFDVSDAPFTIQ